MFRKGLSEDDLRRLAEESDFSDSSMSESTFYDSDADPVYNENVTDGSSDSYSSEYESRRKKAKICKQTQNCKEFTAGSSSNQKEADTRRIEKAESANVSLEAVIDDVSRNKITAGPSCIQKEADTRRIEKAESANVSLEAVIDDVVSRNKITWSDVPNPDDLNKFELSFTSGINQEELAKLTDHKPIDFYLLFIDRQVQDLLVTETNKYAEQTIIAGIVNESITKHSLMSNWRPIDRKELLRFLALIIWMGLDRKPKLRNYWSNNLLYKNEVSKMCEISRSRFEILLHFFHISDNESCPPGNRLYKISPLVQILNEKFQKMCTPKESLCIDETMVPFRGRLSFLQYIPGKRHKYGVKLFKLCVADGYTYAVKVYGGKEMQPSEKSLASRVVMELMQPLLDTGRSLYTDNFYTSVDLAHDLNNRKTHLVGTLRSNRKHNPKAVVNAKLKRGDMKYLQSNTKVVIGKWKDKRDVLFLTTKDIPLMIDVQTKRGPVPKPSTIVDYNSAKSFIDVSDQKAAYNSPVRQSMKWYRKLAVELLTNTALVNYLVLYKSVTGKHLSITEFREQIVQSLLMPQTTSENSLTTSENSLTTLHTLDEKEKRGRCSACYKNFSNREGRASAMKNAKRVYTFCPACAVNTAYMCVKCFVNIHTCSLKK
ncbi:piggyBac transposable element-derived protein 4-like [Diabrotica virgifera virgifera]|uniref:PiggyBac transposable element-derived protein domain-containing protein n=1 Tax=Diabrotica virgifera virgifera TaxID=50390 RepID=A0ABM5JWA0_DIAVI|nr:piggyBac transposable element-derived protein 4-like [Diabrotica virgifera virgifera]